MKKIAIIETIGGHGGTDFYLFGLSNAIKLKGYNPAVYTSDETDIRNAPCEFKLTFKKIYGKTNILIRGLRFLLGTLTTLGDCIKNRYKIIHLHIYQFSSREFLLLKLFSLFGFKIVITVHDVECIEAFSKGKKQKNNHDKFFNHCNAIIVHTEFAKMKLLEKSSNIQDRCFVTPGYDTDTINLKKHLAISNEEAKKKLNIPADKRVVLFFGQIKKSKGIDTLIEAFAKISKDHPEALLVIAGKVWKDTFSVYEDMIKNLDIEKSVLSKIEYIPNEDVPYYLRSADIMALPYTKVYNSGVMIRALSLGIPTICSNTGPFPEFIEDGSNGYLFKTSDSNSLADKLDSALKSRDNINRLKKNALNSFDKFFNLDIVGNKTIAAYKLAEGNNNVK